MINGVFPKRFTQRKQSSKNKSNLLGSISLHQWTCLITGEQLLRVCSEDQPTALFTLRFTCSSWFSESREGGAPRLQSALYKRSVCIAQTEWVSDTRYHQLDFLVLVLPRLGRPRSIQGESESALTSAGWCGSFRAPSWRSSSGRSTAGAHGAHSRSRCSLYMLSRLCSWEGESQRLPSGRWRAAKGKEDQHEGHGKSDGHHERVLRSLERCFRGYEHWLLFNRIRVQFLAPTWWLTMICNSSLRGYSALIGLGRYCMLRVQRDTHGSQAHMQTKQPCLCDM